jgi:hypothetical protein
MDLREMGWKVVEWINLAQDRVHWRDLVTMAMNTGDSIWGGEFLDLMSKYQLLN